MDVLLIGGLLTLAAIHLTSSYAVIAIRLGLAGLGTGLSMAAAMSQVMAAAGDEAGIGASISSTLRQLGGAIAVAVLGSVLSTVYATALRPHLAPLTVGDASEACALMTQGADLASRLSSGASALLKAAGDAFLHGLSVVMLVCAAIVMVAAITSFFCLQGRNSDRTTPLTDLPAPALR